MYIEKYYRIFLDNAILRGDSVEFFFNIYIYIYIYIYFKYLNVDMIENA